jgi:uncharacterized membrane protein YqjE
VLLDIPAALVVLLETTLVSVACSTFSAALTATAIMASVFGGIACIWTCFQCLPQEPSSSIEEELRACTKKTTTAQG